MAARTPEDQDEVALTGLLSEFRIALRDEVDAARRAASSSAVPLVNGRRIQQRALGHQYLFTIESALTLPDGAPGDLLIAGQPPLEATVISIDGLAITLSLSTDMGEFIPRARFQSNLVHLLRKLIDRIEQLAEHENRAGARLLGQRGPQGKPARDRVEGLNDSQAEAVASALGRDTTFIWGPPGTGKTKTIGAIGEQLWKTGRSALLVSHTNAAVDQALVHIADALGEQVGDGSVIRLGEPADLRLMERPRLLAETHIRERASILEAEESELRGQRAGAHGEMRDLDSLIALATWLARATADRDQLRTEAARAAELAEASERLERDIASAEEATLARSDRLRAAEEMAPQIEREAVLSTRVRRAAARVTGRRAEVEIATANRDQARAFHQQAERANAVIRRLRRLPRPDEHAAVVRSREGELESVQALLDRADQEMQRLTGELADVRKSLAAFAAEHGDSPGAVLAEARAREQRLSTKRAAAKKARSEATETARRLEAELLERWTLLEQRRLVRDAPSSIEGRIEALDQARPRAAEQLGGRGTRELEAQIQSLNERIRAIDQRLDAIAEEKSRIEEAVIAEARIVATTLTRAYLRDSIQNRRFDSVILDEASMAPIPALWVAASTAERNIVLVGDFFQLPPIKHSEHPLAARWLGQDIFRESGMQAAHMNGEPREHFVALRTQYRMHPQISAVPNELVYDGLLANGPSTSDDSELDAWFNREWGADAPVVLVDTESLDAWVTGVGNGGRTSRMNFLSATVCVDLAERMLRNDRPELPQGSHRRIIIGAPYRPHSRLVELMLRDLDLDREVVAGTAHTFQGSEAPVMIFDLVNDEPHWRVGLFNPDWDDTSRRLLNVALTRPRHRLIIVGDFAYIRSKSRRAFLGRLIELLEARYPKVEARQLVGAGLAARAAKAQIAAVGGPIEPDQRRLIVTQDDFYHLLARDLSEAEERVVIYSPFITANRLGELAPPLKAAAERGIRIYVVTKTLEERGQADQRTYPDLEETLRRWGIDVIHKRQMHEKLVFVDERILWSGSLNPLSFSATQEVMERRASERVVADYAHALRLRELLQLADSEDSKCPICETPLAMAEGTTEPYWRCPSVECDYTRNLGQSAPRDGLVACASPGCGRPVKFGFWGDEPRWRCTVNPRHRQRIAKSHLKLPKMRALVPVRELRKLDQQFGLQGEPTQPRARATPPDPRKSEASVSLSPNDEGVAGLHKRVDELSSRLAGSHEIAAEQLNSELDELRKEIRRLKASDRRAPGRASAATSGNGRPTPRELELLRLLAAHWSRREIAEQLDLSVETVKSYLKNLYRKLGVHERADAVRVARRRGWL